MGFLIPATLRHLTVAAALAAASLSAQAPIPAAPAATTVVEPPTPLLPDKLGSWQLANASHAEATSAAFTAACSPVRDGAAAESGPTPCAAILKEDGLSRYAINTFQQGSTQVEVFAEQFVDATGAVSAYSFYRSLLHGVHAAPAAVKAATQAVADSEGLLLLAGTAVLRVKGHLSDADLATLVAGLPKVSGRKALAPLLPGMFPANVSGTKPDPSTLRYSLGPVAYQTMGGQLPAEILGWGKSAEVATANYSGRSGKGTLTLLIYPTPQVAGDISRAIEKAINDKGPASFGTVKMRRVGPLLGITSGTFAPDQAQKLVEALHLNEEITFDQKMPLELHAEVRKTATLLQSILAFTGFLTIAAVVIAIFLGGARAGWRVLHGKPAASEPEFLTINLRDKPKALFVPKGPDVDGA